MYFGGAAMSTLLNVTPMYSLDIASSTGVGARLIPLTPSTFANTDHPPSPRGQLTRAPLSGVMTEVGEALAMSDAEPLGGVRQVLDEAFDRAQRLANGCAGNDDIAWLSKGFSAFLGAGGSLSLERCLGLPRNDSALRRACRDYWLRRAWKALRDERSPWRRSEKLAVAVKDFQSRRWPRWRVLSEPPANASELERALFEAFRFAERVPRTAMQLHNIANHRRHS
jgi:hypothetical protein